MTKSIFLGIEERVNYVYTAEQQQWLRQNAGVVGFYTDRQLLAEPQLGKGVENVFSTWGMPGLTEQQIDQVLPDLKAVYYGAGSVQGFARPFLSKGIRVFSAWQANAVPVAEMTVAQILLANKGYFAAMLQNSVGKREQGLKLAENYPGNYGCKVGIIAAGQIGKMVIRTLAARKLQVLVYDPFLNADQIAALGGVKADLETIFRECQTVSNHLPNLPTTQKMLTYDHFKLMQPYATFINTGRAAQVEEQGFLRALQEVPTRFALLDVTDPEPLPEDSVYYSLPNVLLTPHIAGSMQDEVHRMAEYMIEEYKRVADGEKPLYEVSMKMLETMA